MSIFVTGVGGQLGHDVIAELYSRGLDYIAPSHDELDLCDKGAVLEFFNSNDIDAVMHCAAYTAVDKAESEPDLCNRINADATAFLAECCAARDIPLMYISTDYVFPGLALCHTTLMTLRVLFKSMASPNFLGNQLYLLRAANTSLFAYLGSLAAMVATLLRQSCA